MSKDLVKKEVGGVEAIPEHLRQYIGEGGDDISADLVNKSYLSLCHEARDGIKAGHFFDSATLSDKGAEVIITVCRVLPITWRRFNSDFQLDAVSHDGKFWDNGEPLGKTKEGYDEDWACRFIDMIVLLNDGDEALPYILSFKSTGAKAGRSLSTTLKKFSASGEPIFARNFTLSATAEKKGTKTYYVPQVKLNEGFNDASITDRASAVRRMTSDIKTVSMTEDVEREPSEDKYTDIDLD